MDQFVVLHHKLPNDPLRTNHWDLMLQHQNVLWTWALDTHPDRQTSCEGMRLPDHDLKYLQYEGPISGDRGTVEQVMSGVYEWLNPLGNNRGMAKLTTDDETMTMSMQELDCGKWRFHFE